MHNQENRGLEDLWIYHVPRDIIVQQFNEMKQFLFMTQSYYEKEGLLNLSNNGEKLSLSDQAILKFSFPSLLCNSVFIYAYSLFEASIYKYIEKKSDSVDCFREFLGRRKVFSLGSMSDVLLRANYLSENIETNKEYMNDIEIFRNLLVHNFGMFSNRPDRDIVILKRYPNQVYRKQENDWEVNLTTDFVLKAIDYFTDFILLLYA